MHSIVPLRSDVFKHVVATTYSVYTEGFTALHVGLIRAALYDSNAQTDLIEMLVWLELLYTTAMHREI